MCNDSPGMAHISPIGWSISVRVSDDCYSQLSDLMGFASCAFWPSQFLTVFERMGISQELSCI